MRSSFLDGRANFFEVSALISCGPAAARPASRSDRLRARRHLDQLQELKLVKRVERDASGQIAAVHEERPVGEWRSQ
jgi:hypothetical protein